MMRLKRDDKFLVATRVDWPVPLEQKLSKLG
jgi:hypothetical protein